MKPRAYNCVRNESKIYFINYDMNMVYYWDFVEKAPHILDAPPEEDIFTQGLYGNILCSNNKLILVPLNATKIWMYDLHNEEWTGVGIPNNKSKGNHFFGGMLNGNWIYLFGYNYQGILKVNICTCEVIHISIDEAFFDSNYADKGLFNWNYVVNNNYLLTPFMCVNKILQLNLQTDEVAYINVGDCSNTYSGIAWDGEKYWLSPREGQKYVIWDGDRAAQEFTVPKSINCKGQYFGGAYDVAGKILFTSFVKTSLLFEKDNISTPIQMKQSYIFAKHISDNELILGDAKGNIVLYDGEKEVILNTEIPDSEYYEFLKAEKDRGRLWTRQEVLREKVGFILIDYLKLIGD